MGYKIQNKNTIPIGIPSKPEIVDFMEFQSVVSADKRYSLTSLLTTLGIGTDDALDEDANLQQTSSMEEAFSEIDDRKKKSHNKYPFYSTGSAIVLDESVSDCIRDVYVFLLLSTRVNMNQYKIQKGIDGTELFEYLCSEVLKNYFGAHSKSFVFGTGAGNDFKDKVNNMILQLDERNCKFNYPDGSFQKEKDGKVDVVAFIPFADKNEGKFIAFGQCKTGTSWRDSVVQLNPGNFLRKFTSNLFPFTPIAVFMVSESFYDNWRVMQIDSNGFLFDRSRIMEYLPDTISSELLENIRTWNKEVLSKLT